MSRQWNSATGAMHAGAAIPMSLAHKAIIALLMALSAATAFGWATTLRRAKIFPVTCSRDITLDEKVGDWFFTVIVGSGDLDLTYSTVIMPASTSYHGIGFFVGAKWSEVRPSGTRSNYVSISHLTISLWFLVLTFAVYPVVVAVRNRRRIWHRWRHASSVQVPREPEHRLGGRMGDVQFRPRDNQPPIRPITIVMLPVLLAWAAVVTWGVYHALASPSNTGRDGWLRVLAFLVIAVVFGTPAGLCCAPWALYTLRRKNQWMARGILFMTVTPFPTILLVRVTAGTIGAWGLLLSAIVWFHGVCAVIWLVLPDVLPKYPVGHCQSCGYNLTGLVERRCPECGVEFDVEDRMGSRDSYPAAASDDPQVHN